MRFAEVNPSSNRCQPDPYGAEFPLRLDLEKKDEQRSYASLTSYQLAPCPIYRRFGRKVFLKNHSEQGSAKTTISEYAETWVVPKSIFGVVAK